LIIPPFPVNVKLYVLICQLAVIVVSSAGIVDGISLFHPKKVYPSFVGLLGAVTGVAYS
jgi:hypothetical protein